MSSTTDPPSFADLKLNRQLLDAIADAGFDSPTAVQQRTIPLIMAGHDVLGIAPTGTGKTAAFVLPLLMKLKYAQGEHPRGLILAPTRELAIQLNEHVAQLNRHLDLRHAALYGGTGFKMQTDAIEAGLDLVIATPGRLMDHYRKGTLILKELKVLVLDEADKMMDMGFMPQIRQLLEIIPRKRQNLLFSATMPDKVLRLSEEFLEFPERVEVAPQATVTETVEQRLYEVPNQATKLNFVTHLLRQDEVARAFIFTKTRTTANYIYNRLVREWGERVRVIHANKDQNARLNAMNAFRAGELHVLVATDVASRGIDVQDVTHVINFDVPIVYEDYVHRVGRTGRAEHEGVSVTLMNPAEAYHIERIEKIIHGAIPRHALPEAVPVVATSFEEQQEMARAIDQQRKREDPTYQGAFHEKKRRPSPTKKSPTKKSGKRPRRRR